jgi:hypothetical protein
MDHDAYKECFQIAGDQPDPDPHTDLRGVSTGFDLTRSAIGHPMLLYRVAGRELILEADVYQLPGQPLYLILICPLCLMAGHSGEGLKIEAGNKAISYDPRAVVPPFPGWTKAQMQQAFPRGAGGLLSVEEFACTWEVQPELQRAFGFAVCPWRAVIENNVIREV